MSLTPMETWYMVLIIIHLKMSPGKYKFNFCLIRLSWLILLNAVEKYTKKPLVVLIVVQSQK